MLSIRSSLLVIAIIGTVSITGLKAEEGSSTKGMSFGVIAGLVSDNPKLSNNDSNLSLSTDGNRMFAGGITAEISLPVMFSLELDFIYMKRSFSQDTAEFFGTNVSSTTSSGNIEFPLILRFRPIPFINPGFGVYYSRVVTSWTVSADNYTSTTTNYGKNDFGLVFALGTGIPLGSTIDIIADLRYTRSLNDSGGSTNKSLKFGQIQMFVGVKFSL